MLSGEFDDESFFQAVCLSGARALLIGRRALILLGAPVMTADYDLWLHIDDIEVLNKAFAVLDHVPNHEPADARTRGRYVIENGERVDVMVARAAPSLGGVVLDFDSAWSRRREVAIAPGITVCLPCIEDLITTKRWGGRPKDLLDIQFLELLRAGGSP